MNIKPLPVGETLAVVGVEELHAANWRLVVNDITRLFDAHNTRYIEIDLSKARFIDNYGLGSLIALNRIAQRKAGNLRVKNPSRFARSILELTRMHGLIAIDSFETQETNVTSSPPHSCAIA
jgi:anti-anti-sigma factor